MNDESKLRVEKLFKSRGFNKIFTKYLSNHPHVDDIKMEVIKVVCELSDRKIMSFKHLNALCFYCGTTAFHMVRFDGNIYRKYNPRKASVSPPEYNADDYIELRARQLKELARDSILSSLDILNDCERKIVMLYLKYGSYRAVSKASGISHNIIFKRMRRIMKILTGKKQRAYKYKSKRVIDNKLKRIEV